MQNNVYANQAHSYLVLIFNPAASPTDFPIDKLK